MSIVDSIEKIAKWADESICSKIQLKQPDDDAVDATYPYQLVNPAVFVMFVPTQDRLPPNCKVQIPSLCVQLLEGRDNKNGGSIKLRFAFSAWDPGLHSKDIFTPIEGSPGEYRQGDVKNPEAFFIKDGGGWRDVWSFVDVALREIESVDNIGGLRIVREDGITFGPFADQDSIPDYYPYWFAWVEFSVSYGIMRNNPSYNELL